MTPTKRCYRCRKHKPHSDFRPHNSRPDGLRSECKACGKLEVEAYRNKNKELLKYQRAMSWQATDEATRKEIRRKTRERNFLSKHGITVAEADRRIAAQGNRCGLCDGLMGPRGSGKMGAVLDHSHATGTYRAMLHSNCNCLIGFAFDSIPLLRQAIAYLEVHNGEM
jgi:hypothetical protein